MAAAAKYSVVSEGNGAIITERLLMNYTSAEAGGQRGYSEVMVAKVVAVVVLGVGSFLLGLLPVQLAKWFRWKLGNGSGNDNLVISLLLCFGGGVLTFTTFIHLQPEVREEMEALAKEGKAPHFEQLADLVFCAGFFFVYFIEEVVHWLLDRKHDHSEDEAFLHRTVSLRRCSKGKEGSDKAGVPARVSLDQAPDGKALEMSTKSTSTQVLIDPSTLSAVRDGDSFEQNYPSKFSGLEAESQASGAQFRIYSRYPEGEKAGGEAERKEYFGGAGKGVPRGHSHGFFDDDSDSSSSGRPIDLSDTFRGLFTVLALSFHAVFEGLAVGLENDVAKVWYLLLAIATHKFVISFCVGVDLLSTRTRLLLVALYLGTFSFVTPLGIGIGIALCADDPTASGGDLFTVVLQGMAAGTLLYVVFFEVLQRERANSQSGLLQLVAIMAGFGLMFALQFVGGAHHHPHEHVHKLDVPHLLSRSPHVDDHPHHH